MKKKTIITITLFVVTLVVLFVFPQKAKAAAPTVKMGNVALKNDAKWHAYNAKAPAITGWTAGKYKLSTDGKTLELNGVKYSGSKRGINSTAALTVKITGTNTFACKGARGISLGPEDDLKNVTLTGTSSSVLNLKCTDARAICVNACTLNSGTVKTTGNILCEYKYTQNAGTMNVTGNLYANYSSVTGGTLTTSGAIRTYVKSSFSGGKTTVSGNLTTGDYGIEDDGYWLDPESGYLSVSGGNVSVKNANVLTGATISGGELKCSGNLNVGRIGEIFVDEGVYVKISKGTVSIKEMEVIGNATISGGTINATGVIDLWGTLTGTGGSLTTTNAIYIEKNCSLSGANVTASKHVMIGGNLTVSKGVLSGKSSDNAYSGVDVNGNSTISGTGKVVANTSNVISFNTEGTLTVSGGTVEATNNSEGYDCICANNLKITGGTITANTKNNNGHAIYSVNTSTIGGGTITANGYFQTQTLNITAGTVSGKSNIWVYGNLTASGGTLTASGYLYVGGNCTQNGADITASSGVTVSGNLAISKGSVSGTADVGYGVNAKSINVTGGKLAGSSNENCGIFAEGFTMTGGRVEAKTEMAYYAIFVNNEEGDKIINIADDIWVSKPDYGLISISADIMNVTTDWGARAKEVVLQKATSISVKKNPSNQFYEGDYFDPYGLELNVGFEDGTNSTLRCNYSTRNFFTFDIPEDQALSTGTKTLGINCLTKTASTSFTVNDFGTPSISGTASGDRIHLSWEPVEGAYRYLLYDMEFLSDNTAEGSSRILYETTFTDYDLSPGTTKEYYVVAERWSTSGKWIESAKSNVLRLTTVLQAPKIEVAETDYHSVKITWDAVEGAEAYQVYREKGSVVTILNTIDITEYVDVGLTTGVPYSYYVVATIPSKQVGSRPSNMVSATPTFSGSTNLSVQTDEQGYGLSWEPVDGATGYEVYRGNDASGARQFVTTVDGTEYLDSSADIYTKYNYAVRAFRYVESTDKTYYGQWSNVAVTVPTIKNDFTEEEIDEAEVDNKIRKISKIKTTAKTAKKQMIINFEKVPGVYDYRIEYRKLGDKKWTKKWTGKKNSYIIKNMKNGQFLEFRFAAYKYRNGKLVRGKYSTTSRRWYKTTNANVKGGRKSISLNIKKVKGATGYRVFYAEAGKPNKEKSVTSKSNKISIKGLKKGKTYIVRYRPAKKIKGKDYHGILAVRRIKVK